MRNDWIRSTCGHGLIPANGLLYNPPSPCRCYAGVQVDWFNALAGNPDHGLGPAPVRANDIGRFFRGPAYAGVPIDSSPTLLAGRPGDEDPALCVFGSDDGFVTCLQADDGALAWRFRAAPEDRWIQDRGRLRSAWPVHGSVLFQDGLLYVSAGRSSYLDGGIFL